MQRRHQKVLEEAPAPGLDPKLRDRIGERCAEPAARSAIAAPAPSNSCMKTRVLFHRDEHPGQVEHPVTELITGIDIVQTQIRVAAGEKLPWKQKDIQFKGHAVECRINAEHPSTFVPSPGKLTTTTRRRPGIRVDSHVYHGYYVPPHYDSMIGKLIAYGDTRDQAIARMRGALMEMGSRASTATSAAPGSDERRRLHRRRHHIHYLEHKLAEEKA